MYLKSSKGPGYQNLELRLNLFFFLVTVGWSTIMIYHGVMMHWCSKGIIIQTNYYFTRKNYWIPGEDYHTMDDNQVFPSGS